MQFFLCNSNNLCNFAANLSQKMSLDKKIPLPPRNRRMDILRAIAIVLVVLGHNFPHPGFTWFDVYFPMAPYRLAIFLFASGYFFRNLTWEKYPSFLWKKTKGLALPLLGWNIVYAGIVSLLVWRNVVDYLPSLDSIWSFNSLLVEPFVTGHQYTLNLATWFVGMLYPALLLYGVLNIVLRRVNDHVLLGVYLLLAIAGLRFASLAQMSHYWYLPLHISYALFFIHFGKYYRQYIEPYIERLSSWILIPACLLVSYLVVHIGGEVPYSLAWMNYGGRVITPLLMAIAGILLWVRIAGIIERHVVPNGIEKAVSESTWDIMTHHLLVKLAVGWALIHLGTEPELVAAFRSSIWFMPARLGCWALVGLEVVLPVAWHYLFGYFKDKLGIKL